MTKRNEKQEHKILVADELYSFKKEKKILPNENLYIAITELVKENYYIY